MLPLKTPMLALIAAATLCGLAPEGRAADRIVRRLAGPIENVLVTHEDYKEVRFRRARGNEESIPTANVANIEYDDTPAAYSQATTYMANGEWENALNSFQLAATESTKQDWVKVYSALGAARTQRMWGATQRNRYSDAIAAYKAFLKDYPKSRFEAEARYELGLAQAASGDANSAAATFDDLQQWIFNERLSELWEVKALFAKAEGFLSNGDSSRARQEFKRVKTFVTQRAPRIVDDEALKAKVLSFGGRSDLKEGDILIQEKKFRDAERFFGNLLRDPALTPDVKAAATTGLGECQLVKGDIKDAQLTFAKARVHYFNVRDQAAKATYFLGVCAQKLGKAEPDGTRRAKEYFTEVVEYFGDSSWADKARSEIK